MILNKTLFNIYTNPAINSFRIFARFEKIDETYFFDIQGKLIQHYKNEPDNFIINTNDLITGLYLVNIVVHGNVFTDKVHIIK